MTAGNEGCKLVAYPDQKGVWTIGYGQTGPGIVKGLVWTQAQANAAFADAEATRALRLSSMLTGATSQSQFDAMLDLGYNIGMNALSTSTVVRQHNAGNFKAAAAAFLLWDKITVNGVVTVDAGLVTRRQREATVYLS